MHEEMKTGWNLFQNFDKGVITIVTNFWTPCRCVSPLQMYPNIPNPSILPLKMSVCTIRRGGVGVSYIVCCYANFLTMGHCATSNGEAGFLPPSFLPNCRQQGALWHRRLALGKIVGEKVLGTKLERDESDKGKRGSAPPFKNCDLLKQDGKPIQLICGGEMVEIQ